MSDLPGQSSSPGATPPPAEGGVLTELLRTYIDKRDPGALEAFYELLSDDDFRRLGRQGEGSGRRDARQVPGRGPFREAPETPEKRPAPPHVHPPPAVSRPKEIRAGGH